MELCSLNFLKIIYGVSKKIVEKDNNLLSSFEVKRCKLTDKYHIPHMYTPVYGLKKNFKTGTKNCK